MSIFLRCIQPVRKRRCCVSAVAANYSYSSSPSLTAASSNATPTIVVALSGGVDSAVAAALLLREEERTKGARASIAGVHMSNWNSGSHDDDSLSACSAEDDWRDAQRTAQHLHLPVMRLRSLESDYWCHVFAPYVAQLAHHGSMGNPDVDCNTYVKFGALLQNCVNAHGPSTKLATGHYARTWHRRNDRNDGSSDPVVVAVRGGSGTPTPTTRHSAPIPDCVEAAAAAATGALTTELDWLRNWGHNASTTLLLAAADGTKDQSYFLSGCAPAAFASVLFPLGDLYKTSHEGNSGGIGESCTVRELAARWHLPVAHKRDSTGMCFVGQRPSGFAAFVAAYLALPRRRLQFVDVDTARVVHRTEAAAHAVLYTPGQGARLPGAPRKYYIVDHHHCHDPPGHHHHQYHHPAVATTSTTTTTTTTRTNEYHTISVCAGTRHPALYSDSLTINHMHWLSDAPPPMLLSQHSTTGTNWMRAQCRIRHLQPLVDCTIVVIRRDSNGTTNNATAIEAHFDRPVRGISRGQRAVFYALDGLVCLGGGPIGARGPSYWEQGRPLPAIVHPAGHNDIYCNTNRNHDVHDDESNETLYANST